MLTLSSPRHTISSGPVLNRRSHSADKYWTGPIYFLLDRAFSSYGIHLEKAMYWVNLNIFALYSKLLFC